MAEGGVVKNDQVCMKKVLNKAAKDIGDYWKKLARELDVKETTIANIDSQYPSFYEKAHQVLQRWQQKQGYSGGKEKLIEALRVIERNDLAVNIEIHPSTPSTVFPPIDDSYETALQEMSRALNDTYKDCVGSIKKDTKHDHLVYVLKVLHNIQDMNKTLMSIVHPRQANYVYSYEECRTREDSIDQLINLIINSLSGKERSLNIRSRPGVLLRCRPVIIIDRRFAIPPHKRFLPRYEEAMEKLGRTLTSIIEDSKRNITANTGNDLLIFLFRVAKHLRDMNTILMLTANPHRGQVNELYKEQCTRKQSIEEMINLIIESLSFTPRKEEAPSSSTM